MISCQEYHNYAMHRAKYQSLTVKQKLEIINIVQSVPPGKKMKEIHVAAQLCIPASNLSAIMKNKALLRDRYAFGNTKKKHHKDPSLADVNAALFQWFTTARA